MKIKKYLLYSICLFIVAVGFTFCAMISCDTQNIMDLIRARNEVEEEPTPIPPLVFSDPNPPDGITGVEAHSPGSPVFRITCDFPDNKTRDVFFYSKEEGGIFGSFAVDTSVEDGGTAWAAWPYREYDTIYYWYIEAGIDKSDIFSFTTESAPPTSAPTSGPTPTPKQIQFTNPQPPNGATGVSIHTTLCFDVYSPDGNPMDVTFYDESYALIGTDHDVSSGERVCLGLPELSCNTTYVWHVTADDGELTNTMSFSFTTRENQAPDKPSGLYPSYKYTGINPTLSVNVSDPEGDEMTVTFYGKKRYAPIQAPLIEIVKHVSSGSKVSIQWSDLSYSTEYEWYVTACDICRACTQSDPVPFATEQNYAPDPPSNPQPADKAVEVSLDPELCVDVSDPYGDPMDVIFYDMMDVPIATATQVPSGGRACVQWNGLSPNAPYAWSAEADDGDKSTKSSEWSFNTGPTPTPGPAVHCDNPGQIIVFLLNAPECEGGALTKIEFDVDIDQTVTDIVGADNWDQYGTHVTVWFYCGDGPDFIIQGIESIPTNFTLNGTPIPIVD